MGGIAREHQMKALGIGGMEDHVHLLLSLPSSLPIAAAMREIKSASSRWMQRDQCDLRHFEWQEGYGAFSIGWAQVDATLAYIAGQKEHHRKRDFQAEFIAFLEEAPHRIRSTIRMGMSFGRPYGTERAYCACLPRVPSAAADSTLGYSRFSLRER